MVEDDARIAAAVRRGPRGRGLRRQRRRRRARGALDGRRGLLRRHRPRPHAAGPQRLPGLRRPPGAPATGRRSWCSRPRTASSTRPRPSTPAPTTTSPSRSPTRCSWPGSGPWPDGRSTRAVAPVEVGDLRLDAAARRAWRGDAEIALTAREFDVLERLVRTGGDVQSKEDLLAAVWDDDFEGDPNIVEVYVAPPAPQGRRALRAPLDRDAPRRRLPAGRRCRLIRHRFQRAPAPGDAGVDRASSCWSSPARPGRSPWPTGRSSSPTSRSPSPRRRRTSSPTSSHGRPAAHRLRRRRRRVPGRRRRRRASSASSANLDGAPPIGPTPSR